MTMETETAFTIASLEIERQIEECKKSLQSPKLKKKPKLKEQCENLLSELEGLKGLFDEHEATKYKRFGALRRKKIQFKLAKKVMGLKRKYKPLVEQINDVIGE